ncbi:MAG: hypothetical protein PHY50_07315 [Sideroxydans sp.]|nr:hypothetical protein [Sideroxydans sp.]
MTASTRSALLLYSILLLTGCRSESEWQQTEIVPIPPGATLHLRVAHAVNDRLPRMTPEQLHSLLAETRRTTLEHFGVHLEFSEITETSVDALLALIPPAVRQARMNEIYDFKSGTGNRTRLAKGILRTLQERGTKLADALAYARPYLPDTANPRTLQELSSVLAGVLLARLDDWRTIRANDGKPVLDETVRNEWILWDTVGYGELPYDLVITNQLVASAEFTAVELHTALRGGLTTGTTTFSRTSPYGSFVFWSTFPFTDTSVPGHALRGNEDYNATQAAEISGAYLAHEVGHMLFKLGHPFGDQACVMNPVSMLRYREWQAGLDAARCRIGSRAEMRVGAIPETYNAEWLRMAQ